jgi:hypothetical protein
MSHPRGRRAARRSARLEHEDAHAVARERVRARRADDPAPTTIAS